jgi:peroxiredoxin
MWIGGPAYLDPWSRCVDTGLVECIVYPILASIGSSKEFVVPHKTWTGRSRSHWTVTDVRGRQVTLPAEDGVTHLQFRRFAGCPVCNLHLRSFEQRHGELVAAGVHEVVFFHATAEELVPHVDHLPFTAVPDPEKEFYREFGVESSPWVIADPRSWSIVVRALLRSAWLIMRGRSRPPAMRPRGGRYGKPADFLFDSQGRLLEHHYGAHLDDNWSVDDVLSQAAGVARSHASTSPDEARS